MSIRGTVIVECDTADCHAEQVFEGAHLLEFPVECCASEHGWVLIDGDIGPRFFCPDCVEEGKLPK